jgi:small-conductance mechanosensitive channel
MWFLSVFDNAVEGFLSEYSDLIGLILIVVITFVVFSIIFRLIRRFLIKKVKSKKQMHNVAVFFSLIKYLFALFLFLFIFAYYYGSWAEFGFIAGLLTVALGWALQKPITGVLAWLIIVMRRPIRIDDRVVISGVTGDITDITMTHIYLDEVGGTIEGEERSNRTVMLPTSIIFDQEIINYTGSDDYILDEIKVSVTYESDIESAEKILISAVKEAMNDLWKRYPKKVEKKPHTRLNFLASGIEATVRYVTIAKMRNKISTDIRRLIHKKIISSENVEFAYPHSEVLFRKKNKK